MSLGTTYSGVAWWYKHWQLVSGEVKFIPLHYKCFLHWVLARNDVSFDRFPDSDPPKNILVSTPLPEIGIREPKVYVILMLILIIEACATGNKGRTIIDWMVSILSTLTIPKNLLKATKLEKCMSVVPEISITEPNVYVLLMLILIIEARVTWNKVWTIIDWMVSILSTITISKNLLKATKLEQCMSVVPEISIREPKVYVILMLILIIEAHATRNKAWTIIEWMVCIVSTLTIPKANQLKATKL